MKDEQKLEDSTGVTQLPSQNHLSDAQKTMLEMALADAAAGRLVNAATLQELDEAWLQKA